MHLCVNPHVSDATALLLSSLPPLYEVSFIIQRGELERGTRVLSRVVVSVAKGTGSERAD